MASTGASFIPNRSVEALARNEYQLALLESRSREIPDSQMTNDQ
ncbi:hypothetical protein [Coleofasciculus sp. G2-EDA-02]